MNKIVFFLVLLISTHFNASSNSELLVHNSFNNSFRKAYSLNPSIPKGVLESVAYTQSRFVHLGTSSQESSCIGYPTTYGVMGLIENGKGYFRN